MSGEKYPSIFMQGICNKCTCKEFEFPGGGGVL